VSCGLVLAAGCASVDRSTAPRQLAVMPVTSVTHSLATASANYQIARYYQERNQYDAAIDAYRKSLQAKPDYAEAHNGLGVIYASQGRYAEASIELRSALAITPAAAHIYNNLGYSYLLEGKNAEALAVLQLARGFDPDNRRVRDNIEVALRRLGGKAADAPAAGKTPASPAMAAAPAAAQIANAPPAPALPTRRPLDLSTSAQSRMELVQLAPNIFEVRMPVEKAALAMRREVRTDDSVPPAARKFRLEVANGNGTAGLARRVGHLLLGKGMPPARLTNQKPFRQATTEIQYRPGFLPDATGLSKNIHDSVSVVEYGGLKPGTDVRLVLGKDDASILAIVAVLEGDVLLAAR
jgi:Flp pilus assembly protein TadD